MPEERISGSEIDLALPAGSPHRGRSVVVTVATVVVVVVVVVVVAVVVVVMAILLPVELLW